MSVHKKRLITVSFIFAILCLSLLIAITILKIINEDTGINLSQFTPSCSKIYFIVKYSFTYRSLLVEFISTILALGACIAVTVLLALSLKDVCSQSGKTMTPKSVEDSPKVSFEDSSTWIKVHNQPLYILSAITLLFCTVIGGKSLQYIVEGAKCTSIQSHFNIITNYTCLVCFLFSLVLFIFILALIYQRQPLAEAININDLIARAQQQAEEQEINKRIDGEARDFLGYMSKQREQTQQGLLKYEQGVYESNMHSPFRQFESQEQDEEEQEDDEDEDYDQEDQEQSEDDQFLNEKEIRQRKLSKKESKKATKELTDSKLKESLLSDPASLDAMSKRRATLDGLKMRNALLMKGTTSRLAEEEVQKAGKKNGENSLNQQKNDDYLDEVRKILKVTIFDHTKALEAERVQKQKYCPILKYLERDEKEQITQNDYKFKSKNKKSLYEKQQLVFAKKRKQTNTDIRYQFDELEVIKKERLERFGSEWVRQRQLEEQQLSGLISDRFKKRQGIQSIRSRFYD